MSFYSDRSCGNGKLVAATLLLVCHLPLSAWCQSPEKTDRPAVAIGVATRNIGDADAGKLLEPFLVLLELRLAQLNSIRFVERMQKEITWEEFALSRSRTAQAASQSGGLRSGQFDLADLWMLVEPLEREPSESHRVRIRIVETLTGKIRGVALSRLDPLLIEESTLQIAHYLESVLRAPQASEITVAVGAFETNGRFDRLRPLELGVRDMLTSGMLNVSDFNVLQRSNLKDLIEEMRLIESGWIQPDELPDTLPHRGSAYFVRGSIDERYVDGDTHLHLNTEVIDVTTDKVVSELHIDCRQAELKDSLARQVLQIINVLSEASHVPVRGFFDVNAEHETERLLQRALVDLYRFRRRSPIHGGSRDFRVPGMDPAQLSSDLLTTVRADSVLGKHLLAKSIDRLETVLFLVPNERRAAYALAFCLSHHIDGIGDPVRGGKLLQDTFLKHPNHPIGEASLRLLAGISFHHTKGISSRVAPEWNALAAEQIRFAFENMPVAHRDYHWARMLELYSSRYLAPQQIKDSRPLIRIAMDRIDDLPRNSTRRELIDEVSSMMSRLNTTWAKAQLLQWSESDDSLKRYSACRRLASAAGGREESAKFYQQGAEAFRGSDDFTDRRLFENMLIQSARCWRRAERPDQALKVLDSFSPRIKDSLNRGYYDLVRGNCLVDLGKHDEAIALWTLAGEQVPNLSYNSDIVKRIQQVGGVPLDPNRTVDVRYLKDFKRGSQRPKRIASDGHRLFVAGGDKHVDLVCYDIDAARWETLLTNVGIITSLLVDRDTLWIGTEKNGLWELDLKSAGSRHWTTDNGLPDSRIETVTACPEGIYVGIGKSSSGGLVRFSPDRDIHVFVDENAPTSVPLQIVPMGDELLVRTIRKTFCLDRSDERWVKWPSDAMRASKGATGNPALFAGRSGIWTSKARRELAPLQETLFPEDHFRAAWYPSGGHKAGYQVTFLIETDDSVWFGGGLWKDFRSAGLYRADKSTGEFTHFGPRDGFRINRTFGSYDAVWARNRLWVVSHEGIVEVVPRPTSERPSGQ